ncbi:type II toxin-antitoxin system HicB family antitoxin [Gelria sp. Kuro-4]|uniref:type II toxin-antitoxin system HicB family antitoxin n=1 Tax=Gelria sp. Kuro-4 TaxID=2796927 RepID=UPI001BEF3184|nr:type II toxin-antitoxin system HicB family antitoxin [Gelria sp. Kuro-4]BCV23833.1 hypothetical protein kuro4_06060 [Gelria sp. Kuro-4]
MLRRFKVILEWDEEVGAYTVTVPALPGCVTQGRTVEESLERVREAITGYLKAMKLHGESVPKHDPRMVFGEVEVSL